jgi:hypothetical protein
MKPKRGPEEQLKRRLVGGSGRPLRVLAIVEG